MFMNITIYYGSHDDKTLHTMDCFVEDETDDEGSNLA